MGTTRPLLLLQDPEKLAQEVAQQFTDTLDDSERVGYSKPPGTRYPLMGDVEFAIEELHNVLMWANQAQTRIACIREDDGFVPVIGVPLGRALRRRFPLDHLPPHSGFSQETFHYERLLGQFLRPDEILWALPGEIAEMVFFPLMKFLAVRFQWLADNPLQSPAAPPVDRSLPPLYGRDAHLRAPNPLLQHLRHQLQSRLRRANLAVEGLDSARYLQIRRHGQDGKLSL